MDGVKRDVVRLGISDWRIEMDGVKRDVERLGIRDWRTKAIYRDGWRLVIESAKTLHGL
jgi:hypothetical protein